jgi:hypothetical protein
MLGCEEDRLGLWGARARRSKKFREMRSREI